MAAVVEVLIWGQRVGAVALDSQRGCYAFGYSGSWTRAKTELSPIRMPVRREPYVFPDLSRESFHGLPGMLADALPDAWGNALVDRVLQAKGIPMSSITTLDRLCYMGQRAMGALEFRPAIGAEREQGLALELRDLVDEARLALQARFEDESATEALRGLIQVGTSAGGARAKAVIAWNEATGEMRSGQFDAPNGYEQWLLKFDGLGEDRELGLSGGFGRIEYAYYLMAQAAGIRMTRCMLHEEDGRAHFMTLRFDREAGQRHHVQTLGGLDHLDYRMGRTHDYAQAFMAMDRLGLGQVAFEEMFRRMAFNVMGRNCDDHVKNISFRMKQGQPWELAPAYDVTFAHNPGGVWTSKHQMSVNGKFDGIARDDLLVVAERFNVGRGRALLAQVREAVEAWPVFAREAGVEAELAEGIRSQHILL